MASHDDEERRLRSVALQNAQAILLARQRAERELAAERERLRITLASIGDAVISTDAEGRVAYLNGVAEALTGWTQAEAVGRPLPDVFHIVNELTRQPAENPALRALREGVVVGLANHTVLIARDGTEWPIDDSAAPMLDEYGAPVGTVLVFRDVTEHRRADEAKARLAAIVESSDDAIISKTLDSVIRSWNAGAERVFGYKAEEAVGRPITLIIPPERLNEEREILDRLSRGERIEHYDTVRVAKDGRRLDISLSVSPIRDAEGRVIGASKVARDVTDRRRAEEALRASEQRFRTLAAHAPVGIFLTDRDGNCLFVNERWCEMAGLSPEEAEGQGWAQALHPDDRERVFREWNAAAETGRPFASEYRFRTRQGQVTWLEGNAAGRHDEAGQVCEYVGTLTDITERREAVEALQEADRRKDEFLAMLAHELRNPLAPIRNGVQIFRTQSPPIPALQWATEVIDRQVNQMTRLIDDLLDVSRITLGKIELRKERVELSTVVNSAVEASRPLIEKWGHELSVTVPPQPIQLEADLTRLSQVLMNLLNNAAKYMGQAGHIWVTAEREGGHVLIRVRDTGIGIPPEMLPRIFDMFTQVDRSLERSEGGLGIGLTLVQRLVEMHGGTVEAHSDGPGRGSEFIVRLPVAVVDKERQPDGMAGDGEKAVAPAAHRILVVDDNQDAAESLGMLLSLVGHEVHTAYDGLEAVKAVAAFRPDVALLDIGMPKLNGHEAARRIRELPGGTGVALIALTGWGQEEDRRQSREAGFDHHMTKPVEFADLQKLLTEILPGRPPRR